MLGGTGPSAGLLQSVDLGKETTEVDESQLGSVGPTCGILGWRLLPSAV